LNQIGKLWSTCPGHTDRETNAPHILVLCDKTFSPYDEYDPGQVKG
jgi:hypothetical protein